MAFRPHPPTHLYLSCAHLRLETHRSTLHQTDFNVHLSLTTSVTNHHSLKAPDRSAAVSRVVPS